MTILFLDRHTQLGSAQWALLDLLTALQDTEGMNPVVAAPGRGPLLERAASLGAKTAELPLPRSQPRPSRFTRLWQGMREIPRLSQRLRQLAEREHAGLIYVNDASLLPALAWRPPLRNGQPIPVVWHARELPRQLSGLTYRAARRLSTSAIAASDQIAEALRGKLPNERVHLIRDSVGPLPERETVMSGEVWNIGIIGRIDRGKAQLQAMEAIAILLRDLAGPQGRSHGTDRAGAYLRFVFAGAPRAGDLDADAYFQQVQDAGIQLLERDYTPGRVLLPVEFLGWTEPEWIFPQLDLVIVPGTRFDAPPRTLLEAFAARVPVIAPDLPAIRALVTNAETGFLFQPGSAESLARAVIQAIEAPAIEAMRRQAFQGVEATDRVQRYAGEVRDVLRRLAADQ